jgi:hypothetical protein
MGLGGSWRPRDESFAGLRANSKCAGVNLPACCRDQRPPLENPAMKRERGMAVDVWEMAAECARAIEGSEDATRRAVLGTLQKLWIELGEKERLLSEQEVLKEMEDLRALHAQLLGQQSNAPDARHATGAAGRHNPAFERDAAKARVFAPSRGPTDP